jgi:hypothetical protein
MGVSGNPSKKKIEGRINLRISAIPKIEYSSSGQWIEKSSYFSILEDAYQYEYSKDKERGK